VEVGARVRVGVTIIIIGVYVGTFVYVGNGV